MGNEKTATPAKSGEEKKGKTTIPVNGKVVKSTPKKEEGESGSTAPVKAANKILAEAAAKEKKQPTASERLDKLEEFQELGKRHLFLKERKQDMLKFKAGSGQTQSLLEFKNEQGTVQVTNTGLIAHLVSESEKFLNARLEETEIEVEQFEI